ncbi:MAG: hypothetical protein HKL90_00990 [Elusimicrobia bacterium]|nr:hypothetical protein [Elusimicrobiota bacterium]
MRASNPKAAVAGGCLTVCGVGIDRPQDVTLGTIQALKDSEILFYMHGDGERLLPFLRTFCVDVRLFHGAKFESLGNEEKIKSVARDICVELKKGKKVTYVTYGHPAVFSDGLHVLNYCRKNGYECRVLPGVSAVDHILVEASDLMGVLSNGFLVCNADETVNNPKVLAPEMPVILFGVDTIVSRGRFGEFCGRIEASYPAEQPIYAIKCRDSYGEPVRLVGRVLDLRGWESRIIHMMSIILPGVPRWERRGPRRRAVSRRPRRSTAPPARSRAGV